MKKKFSSLLLRLVLIATVASGPDLQASVRFSSGTNQFSNPATYATTTGWALPEGDWTLGIWDNHFQGNDGWLINGPINLCFVPFKSPSVSSLQGRFIVGGADSAGNLFGSGPTINNASGTLPVGYPGRVTGKFTPRLHIIRRNAGKSEYLVAEGGHAPVLVSSETRPFGATAVHYWGLASLNGWSDLYDADLEGLFFATAAVSDKDIGLMAAGVKPSSVSSLTGHLTVYYPLETAPTASTPNPLPNQGSDSTVVFKRLGALTLFTDGPMLRGATAENNTPAQVTEPTNVVALNSFQPFQIIRHLNGLANVQFTGFDYGTGAADIEIRFLDVEHATSTAWQTLVLGSAGGGAAIAATIPVPKGYWKTIEVRRVNSAGGTGDSSRPNRTWSRWAVGEVVVVWGDSIQGQVENSGRVNALAPNGYIAKYPSNTAYSIPGDSNPISTGMWNLLMGGGMGGGVLGENSIANGLSAASQCCVGITVSWSGATRLAYWTSPGSTQYAEAKSYCLANGGLNKPNVITWVGNLASANYGDDFYKNLNDFKAVLNADFGAGTWQLLLAPTPIMYNGSGGSEAGFQILRDACWRWVRDNPQIGANAGGSFDHVTYDGVHPTSAAWDIMGPRWGNAAGYLRDQLNYADPRAGEIVKFYRSAGDLIAQVQLYAGTALSLKNPGANITGLTLSSDNFATTIPITSAVLINGTTFRITPASTPAGSLKLRYLYGRPGVSGTTPAQMGTGNILYVNAGPTNIVGVQPIWGTASNNWSLAEYGTPPPPPTITTGTLPAGQVRAVYNQTLAATGGVTPYSWSLVSGALPSGLTLISAGVISGTPTSSGTSSFTLRVTGNDSAASTATFSLAILPLSYASWQASQFTPSEIASGLAELAADSDKDGLSNLLEYGFGGNSKSGDMASIAPAVGLAANRLQVSFLCDANCTDIDYTVQASDTLVSGSWTDIARSLGGATTLPIGSLSTVSDTGIGLRRVTVTDSGSSSVDRRFIRAQITKVSGSSGGGTGGGGSLSIVNGGFESGSLTGWTTIASGGYGSGAGVINNVTNQTNQYPTFSNPLPGTALGTYYASVAGYEGYGPEAIYQDVSANGQGNAPLQPNTTYTLTVAAGVGRYDSTVNNGTIALINGTSPATGTVLATKAVSTLGFTSYANNFKDLTVTFTTGSTVSGDLTIELYTNHGYSATGTIKFDNVRLTKTP